MAANRRYWVLLEFPGLPHEAVEKTAEAKERGVTLMRCIEGWSSTHHYLEQMLARGYICRVYQVNESGGLVES